MALDDALTLAARGAGDDFQTAYVFRALGSVQRLRIIRALVDRGPLPIGDLRRELTAGDAWEHVKVLKAAGLVRVVGVGRASQWEIVPGALGAAAALAAGLDSSDPR